MPLPVLQSLEITNPSATRSSFQPADEPLFVVGMFRSGTSLLYALLNQHPQIALMYEGDLVHLHSLFWIRRKTAAWLRRWEFWNAALTRHKVDTSEIPAGITDLNTAVRAVYTQYARQKCATIWGCKSPTYHDETIRLSRTFPNARFVIIWRDLRHICRSILDAAETSPFFNRTGMALRAIIGYHDLKLQCDSVIRRGGQVHQLNYEDLVRDPAGTMKAICEFLKIPFDPRMTNLVGADRDAISNFDHHSLVKGEKIIATRNGAAGLPVELTGKIERYVKMWREQYGGTWPAYPKSFDPRTRKPSAWERSSDRVTYQVLQFIHHAAPIVFSFVPMRLWGTYRKYIVAKRVRRLLEKAGPEKQELIKKAALENR